MCAETETATSSFKQWQGELRSYRSFNLNLDLRRNGRSPFNLYHLAARWKSIEISILRQGNLEDVRLTRKNLLIQTKEAQHHFTGQTGDVCISLLDSPIYWRTIAIVQESEFKD